MHRYGNICSHVLYHMTNNNHNGNIALFLGNGKTLQAFSLASLAAPKKLKKTTLAAPTSWDKGGGGFFVLSIFLRRSSLFFLSHTSGLDPTHVLSMRRKNKRQKAEVARRKWVPGRVDPVDDS